MTDTSKSPYRIRARVRGMGVADMTSRWGRTAPPFSARAERWATPKRCCSSAMTSPRSRYSTSWENRAWVPTTRSVSPAASARMLGILKDQRLNGKIPFWLDGKVACAHKTGEDKNITHDVGILYAPRPFVLCICGDPVDAPALNALMAQAARLLVQEQGVILGGEPPAF